MARAMPNCLCLWLRLWLWRHGYAKPMAMPMSMPMAMPMAMPMLWIYIVYDYVYVVRTPLSQYELQKLTTVGT